MIIKNVTNNIYVTSNAKEAVTVCDRLIGLLNPNNSRFLIIKTHFGIHTIFMSNSIDVIVLDKGGLVVKLKANLRPNQLFFYNPLHSTVIEMPSGSISKFSIHQNDKIYIG
jgi:uncharacterized membrane protein (UPF0127 family)